MELLLVGHALLADDVPQRIGIRRGMVRSGEQSAQRNRTGEPHHPRTPPGRRTSAPPSIMPVA
jgi:hypothetical protein